MRFAVSLAANLAAWSVAWIVGDRLGVAGFLAYVVVASAILHAAVPRLARRWIARIVSREIAARVHAGGSCEDLRAHDAICFHGCPGRDACACPCHAVAPRGARA